MTTTIIEGGITYTEHVFELPSVQEKDHHLSVLNAIQSTIFSEAGKLIDPSVSGASGTKIFVKGMGQTFTGISIVLAAKDEGALKATVTGVAGTVATELISFIAAIPATALGTPAAGIAVKLMVSAMIGAYMDALANDVWDRVVEKIKSVKSDGETYFIETQGANANDIKNIAKFTKSVQGANKYIIKTQSNCYVSNIQTNADILSFVQLGEIDGQYIIQKIDYNGNFLNEYITNINDPYQIMATIKNTAISMSDSGANVTVLSGSSIKEYILGNDNKNVIYGTFKNDIIYSGGGDDVVYGGAGNDKIYGGTGSDFLVGDADNDELYGDSNIDTLIGDTGNDTLDGGTGNDRLFGGADYDTYIFRNGDGEDYLFDSDGKGCIQINGKKLNGTYYKDEENGFTWSGSTSGGKLYLDYGGGKITIDDFKNGNFGITLKNTKEEEDDPEPNPNPEPGNDTGDGSSEGSGSGTGSDGDGGSGSGSGDGNGSGENPNPNPNPWPSPGGGGSGSGSFGGAGGFGSVGGLWGGGWGGIGSGLRNDLLKHMRDFLKNMRKWFEDAMNYKIPLVDPLIFDLDGDGKIGLTNTENGVNFDMDNDGTAQRTAWVSDNDGILVLDRNGNGIIDNGLELFGDKTVMVDGSIATGGLQALADLDSNKDGKINSQDTMFNFLKFLKADGTLVSMADTGVVEINLTYVKTSITDAFGNKQVKSATFVKTDGTTGTFGEFTLTQDNFNSLPTEWLTVSDDISELPEAFGAGWVTTLQQTMMKDETGELKALVEAFVAESDITAKHAMMESIIFRWAGVQDALKTGRGSYDAQKLAALEQFCGRFFKDKANSSIGSTYTGEIVKRLNSSWNSLVEQIYTQLAAQTHLKEFFDVLGYDYFGEQNLAFNNADAIAYIQDLITADGGVASENTLNLVKDFSLAMELSGYSKTEGFADLGNIIKYSFDIDVYYNFAKGCTVISLIEGTHLYETINGTSGDDIIYGWGGEDTLNGGDGNDILYGGANNDALVGGKGDDILYASRSTNISYDNLNGGEGNDVYIIDPVRINGLSNTHISDNGNGTTSIDKVIFKGVASTDIKITPDSSGHLKVSFNNYPNLNIRIQYQNKEDYRIEFFEFSDMTMSFDELAERYLNIITGTNANDTIDSTIWSKTLIGGLGNDTLNGGSDDDTLYGNEGDDKLYGNKGNDVLYGEDGNDTLNGGDGNDIIYGGDGDDKLYGGNGDDILYAGRGNDILKGEGGDDIYIIDPAEINGPSNTIIEDSGNSSADKIIFKGIASTDVKITSDTTGNLLVSFNNYPDNKVQINIQNNKSYRIEIFEFSDIVMNFDEIAERYLNTITGTDGNDSMISTPFSKTLDGGAGNDTITGSDRNDILHGGYGNDKLIGGKGNDTLNGEDGDDTLEGGDGDDILYAGRGNDYLYGGNNNDTYIIDPAKINGTSQTIIHNSGSNATADKIIFRGIASTDVKIVSDAAGHLFVTFNDYPDNKVQIYYQNTSTYRVEFFEFSDITMSHDELVEKYLREINGTDGNDTINSTPFSKILYGGAGNDTLNGGIGNDTLYGGLGDDKLYGGTGNDIYSFNLGDGNDIIKDTGGNDTVRFGSTVDKLNIAFYKQGNDLIIDYGNGLGQDKITIQSQSLSSSYAVEKFELNDGTYITNTEINQLIQNMTAYAQNNGIEFTNINSVKNNQDLMNLVANSWHN